MEEQNISNSNEEVSEIKDGDLLNTANNILSLLNYSQKLENEEDLFLDDFYVSIIGNLLSDLQPEINPGNTLEEKAEIMNKLVQSLSQAIEVDLPHINGAAIILNHDKYSAKNLLDVISELIKTIIDNNLEEVQEDKNEENNFSEQKKKRSNKNEINIDDSNNELNKNIEEYKIDENSEEKEKEYKISENIDSNENVDNDNIKTNNENDNIENMEHLENMENIKQRFLYHNHQRRILNSY